MKQSRSDRDQTLAERGDEVGGESLNREESEERKDSSDGRGKGKKNCATPAMKSRPVGRPPLRRDALADGELERLFEAAWLVGQNASFTDYSRKLD